ncbi:MAG: histidine--tRNA ligase [Nanoarchaeota archaeon]|nr:histidine--tRNA ligase [Nanoarchaeota archaeon]
MSKNNKSELAKGVKDWYGEEAILRNQVRDSLREIFERYGYNPLETPIIERLETMSRKGGGEIQKEVFKLKDQGQRDLALRFDQTVPLARFVAMNRDLKMPFKRYAIGPVFRDGPTQPEQGRYRIFTQCDADIVGVKDMAAEAELFSLAKDAFSKLGLGEVEVKINNRKVLDGILDTIEIPEESKKASVIILDKMDKIGWKGVKEQLLNLSDSNEKYIFDDKKIGKLFDLVKFQKDNLTTFSNIKSQIKSEKGLEGLDEIKSLLDYAQTMKYNFIQFNPSLARGLDYYTGTTIEVYLKNRNIINSAILAGGRYDQMIGDFIGGNQEIPAVGFSFGLERIILAMQENNVSVKKSLVDIYLIPLEEKLKKHALVYANILRNSGLNVDIDMRANPKLIKSIKHADALGIVNVGLLGENEFEKNALSLKNLKYGKQETIPLDNVSDYIQKWENI